jgi:hypothetical protein
MEAHGTMRNSATVRLLLAALCLGGLSLFASGEDKPATPPAAEPAKESFGFSGMEMYKLDWDTNNLHLADVNGDGLTDIIVVNNARARIECLLQRPKTAGAAKSPAPKPADLSAAAPAKAEAEPNEIPNDANFDSRPYLTEKHVFSLEVGDLNGDGRTDMAYYGDPRELVVVYQDKNGQWGTKRTFDIADGSTQMNALAIGDLRKSGRNDLVLLGTDGTYFFYQNAAGQLESPIKESGLPDGAVGIAIRDFLGNGRKDLLYFCSDEAAPFSFRFQNADGRLGPEVRCKAPPMSSVALGDLDGDGSTELVAIERSQGRLAVYKVGAEPADPAALLDGPFERYALRGTGSRRAHPLAFGPLTDPKRMDIVVADPDAAEIELFRQNAAGQWDRQAAFPCLQGVTDVAVFEVEGAPAVLVLSPDEPMLGLMRLDAQGRLTFPRSLPIVGKPTCMCVADLFADGKREILYVSSQERDKSIRVLAMGPEATFVEKMRIPIEDPRADPDGLLVADANQDGLPDILLFTPYQEMRIFKQAADQKFIDVSRGPDYGKGLVQGVTRRSVSIADLKGDGKPTLLVASKSFARALRLDAKDRLEIVEQFNGLGPTSQIVAASAIRLNGSTTADVLLADQANHCLSVLRANKTGAYEIADKFQTGALNFERLHVTDLNASDPSTTAQGRPEETRMGGKPAVLLVGQNDFHILRPGMPRVALRLIASYESPVHNARLQDVEVGDLRGDGRPQIIVTEGTKQLMELLTWRKEEPRIQRVLAWPVFEAKAFTGGRMGQAQTASAEPREFAIGAVTGPKPAIVLLIHDRILIYKQE